MNNECSPNSGADRLLAVTREVLHKILLVADAAVGERQTKETLLQNMATVQELAAGCTTWLMHQARNSICVYDRPAIWDEDRAQLFLSESEPPPTRRTGE